MRKVRERGSGSIFGHTLLLATGVVLMLAAATVTVILLTSPPYDPPITTYEIARLLKGQPLADDQARFRRTILPSRAITARVDPVSRQMRLAIARNLDVRLDDVFFDRPKLGPATPIRGPVERYESQLARQAELYGDEGQFNPPVFGAFRAGLRKADGSWRVVERSAADATGRWQLAMIQWIVLAVLLTVPIAWLFSKRIAMPIRAFATAAERLGGEGSFEPVEVKGPAEIRMAAKSLNEMQCRLKRYIAERTSIVGAIAHDLRTPLSRLSFLVTAAPDDLRRKCEGEIAEMEQMIAGTLDFVQNETRTPQPEAIDLQLLVEGIVDDLADIGQDAHVEAGPRVTIVGDPVLLRRLFANLIMNAVMYGKRARVSIRVEGKEAIVEVADEGPGLPEDELERVFEPFYRTERSRNRSTGGMGLGLAIVRAAARSHGGTVRLFNRKDGGLCAEVRLPIAAP